MTQNTNRIGFQTLTATQAHHIKNMHLLVNCVVRVCSGFKQIGSSHPVLAGQTYTVTQGDFVIMPAGYSYTMQNVPKQQPYQAEVLFFDGSIVAEFLAQFGHVSSVVFNSEHDSGIQPTTTLNQQNTTLTCSNNPALDGTWQLLKHSLTQHCGDITNPINQTPNAQSLQQQAFAIQRHHVFSLLLLLAQQGGFTHLFRPTQTLWQSKVQHFILGSTPQHWQLKNSAMALHVSPATLARKLKLENTSFLQVVDHVRLTKAITLVQTTALPISFIAQQVGYLSSSKLSQRFKQRYGVTPLQLRKMYVV